MTAVETVLLLVLFALAWLVLCVLLAGVGGWRQMAEQYAQGDRPFQGESRRFERLSLGWLANYGRCLVVGRGPAGVRLALLPLVPIAHPPLVVPWEDLGVPRVRGIGPLAVAEFRFARTPDVAVKVRPRLARWLMAGTPENRLTRSP